MTLSTRGVSFLGVIFSFVIFLSACAVGPDYVRRRVTVPTQYKEARGKKIIQPSPSSINWKKAEPQDHCDRHAWWTVFHDAELNKLEDKLNISNQSIKNAYYNYRQARALVDEARAAFYPTLTGDVSVTKERSGGGAINTLNATNVINNQTPPTPVPAALAPGSPTIPTSTSTTSTSSTSTVTSSSIAAFRTLEIDASWEPDIWGLVRRTVEASAAGAEASAALYESTRLSSQALLAQYYFELRGYDILQKLLDDTVIDYKKALQITLNQYASGVASRADIVQAQSVLEAAEALAINNGIERAVYEHAIAVLIGQPPALFSLKPYVKAITPPAVPLELPSALLERRPDIAQAERLMAQANARIGIAVAAYFPALTLSGLISVTGTGLSHLVSFPIYGWALGSQLTELLFDGGLRSATVRAAKAAYKASIASYRQVVLAAFQNVEDNLVTLRILNDQAVVEKKAVESARFALKLVMNQYKSGTVAYSSVITAQINAFTVEQTAVNVDYQRMTSAVGLITALGGGWDVSDIACAAG